MMRLTITSESLTSPNPHPVSAANVAIEIELAIRKKGSHLGVVKKIWTVKRRRTKEFGILRYLISMMEMRISIVDVNTH
jgi:hypothetical protein